ncbi:MAG TPA: XRE family transcriptional regulator [Dehalococcoidales bacterium]|nr:XRE family transcriptional regulator [Dehalococcoidales bacterium]
MTEAYIKRNMLKWARARLNLTLLQLAQLVKINPAKLDAWENGSSYPSINQAIELSKKLRIPFGYLYLSTPPTEIIPLPDLRTMANKPIDKPSPEFLDVVYDAFRKQQWYREYLINENVPKLEFAGKFKVSDGPALIATDIQHTLDINNKLRKESSSWEQFLTTLIRRVEKARILVLRNGVVGNNVYRKLDVHEFRGFAICDETAPLVFINGRDYKTAQIFTLIHEITHIWIGESGISNLDYQLKDTQQRNVIDRLCDSVASEVLVPKNEFMLRWDDLREIDYNIENLAKRFRVSSFVILRRAYTLDIISKSVFHDKYDDLLTKIKKEPDNQEGNFYNLLTSRNSLTLTSILIAGVAEGSVSPKEAAELLNIRAVSLKGIESQILVG